MSTLTEEDFADIELAASKSMREWERGYYCQDINVRHHISWWIMQETARRVATTRPIVAEQQRGGDDYKAWYEEAMEAANEAGYGPCSAAQAIRMLADELNLAEARVAAAELLRPIWAKGYTSDSIAAQSTSCALAELWKILGVSNQTEAVGKLRNLVAS